MAREKMTEMKSKVEIKFKRSNSLSNETEEEEKKQRGLETKEEKKAERFGNQMEILFPSNCRILF